MRSIDQIHTQLIQLRTHLEELEVIMTCPSRSDHEKKIARSLANILTGQIKQMEWILGLREDT